MQDRTKTIIKSAAIGAAVGGAAGVALGYGVNEIKRRACQNIPVYLDYALEKSAGNMRARFTDAMGQYFSPITTRVGEHGLVNFALKYTTGPVVADLGSAAFQVTTDIVGSALMQVCVDAVTSYSTIVNACLAGSALGAAVGAAYEVMRPSAAINETAETKESFLQSLSLFKSGKDTDAKSEGWRFPRLLGA